ncbi:hypothetical protein DP116_10810 [Brasilonema bromeliae SPC951]|uniref:Uncharacterized protein n=1 Tax=Brasilonema bromeliae SPC951 TaxID=385972 RepID=A0ABX1P8L3_9CYAN|nr:hypothetical protein [Brasilonema bromeliae SPC951]
MVLLNTLLQYILRSKTLYKTLLKKISEDTGSIGDKGYSIDKSKSQYNIRGKQLPKNLLVKI